MAGAAAAGAAELELELPPSQMEIKLAAELKRALPTSNKACLKSVSLINLLKTSPNKPEFQTAY